MMSLDVNCADLHSGVSINYEIKCRRDICTMKKTGMKGGEREEDIEKEAGRKRKREEMEKAREINKRE